MFAFTATLILAQYLFDVNYFVRKTNDLYKLLSAMHVLMVAAQWYVDHKALEIQLITVIEWHANSCSV